MCSWHARTATPMMLQCSSSSVGRGTSALRLSAVQRRKAVAKVARLLSISTTTNNLGGHENHAYKSADVLPHGVRFAPRLLLVEVGPIVLVLELYAPVVFAPRSIKADYQIS
eukprot:4735382-Pleurochrysis_carterae.AAC.5